MTGAGGNGSLDRDRCARCGRAEGIEPFDCHAYRELTTHGELPKGLKDLGKIFQGRSVYHDLVQLSAMICGRCVRWARWRRAVAFAAVVALLGAAAVPLWLGHQRYMERFEQARVEMDQWDPAQHPELLTGEMAKLDDGRLESRIFDEEQGRLQRAKDEALLYAVPLRWALGGVAALGAAVAAWGAWQLRWERVGQRLAASAVQPAMRKRGLKHVRPGRLEGGRVLEPRA